MNENLFMEILYPEEISYTYKIRPARTFGGVFVSILVLSTQIMKPTCVFSEYFCIFRPLMHAFSEHSKRILSTCHFLRNSINSRKDYRPIVNAISCLW